MSKVKHSRRRNFALMSLLGSACTVAFCAATARGQVVNGDLISIGFSAPTPGGSGSAFRQGQWVPIEVQLTCQGSKPFQGSLSVECRDLDGDLVEFIEPLITVTPNEPKRAWCYALTSEASPASTVLVLGSEGAVVGRISLKPCEMIDQNAIFVLDLSDTGISAFDNLRGETLEGDLGRDPFMRPVVAGRMAAKDLPDRWFGLEAVDVIIWDRPNLSTSAISNAQLEALQQWVSNGGQLVIGAGDSWNAIAKSPLAAIMPLEGEAATVETTSLPALFDRYLFGRKDWVFPTSVVVTTAKASPSAVVARKDMAGGTPVNLLTMRMVGAGRVTVAAARLRDLFNAPLRRERFFNELLDMNPVPAKFRTAKASQAQLGNVALSLYPDLTRPVSYLGETSALGVIAVFFVISYIGLATFATWWWLGRHKITQHSWTIFAVMAAAASALSLGTVSLFSGFAGGVRSVNIVSLEAGSSEATARCYFGFRSRIRQFANLSLTGPGSFLRPMATEKAPSALYATPLRYEAIPAKAALRGAPMRATLKQFEGFWRGRVTGTIRAQLTVDRATGRLTPASALSNDLDRTLAGAYLLYVDPRLRDNDPLGAVRAAGMTEQWDESWKFDVVPAFNVICLPIAGPIKPGDTIREPGADTYRRIDSELAKWQSATDKPAREAMPDLPTLWHGQVTWAKTVSLLSQADPTVNAALLASTRNFFIPNVADRWTSSDRFETVARLLSTNGLPSMDVSHWLVRGYAVLLAWSDQPGPAELQKDGGPLSAGRGFTLYRVRIPLNEQGQAPTSRAAN